MKRMIALLTAALASTCVFAESPKYTWPALTAAGVTISIRPIESVNDKLATQHTLQIIVTGSPSACTVRLEGSLDGTNYFDLSGSQTCTSSTMFHVNGKPVTLVRANLLTWTGGANAVISYRGSN